MTILKAGLVAALPAVAGFIGGILGGVLSDRLLKANCSLAVARKTPIVVGMLLSMSVVACNYVSADWLVIGYLLQGTGSFAAALAFIGANAAVAILCYLVVVGPIKRFEFRQSPYQPVKR